MWGTVAGNQATLERLQRQVDDQRLTHALLLCGPDSVGKTTVALTLVRSLLAGTGWSGPVEQHPDFWLEDSDSERIGIDSIRSDASGSLQQFFSLRPYMAGRRVAVIARADRLTEDAANCLLKTLEEPPSNCHVILATSKVERLPETIRSRCEQYVLAPTSPESIEAWLMRDHGVDQESASRAARLSAGRPGRALSLATNRSLLEAEEDVLGYFLRASSHGVTAALAASDELAPASGAQGRERLLVQLDVVASFLRDAACYAAGEPKLAQWTSYDAVLRRWAGALPLAVLSTMLDRCLQARTDVAAYAHPRLTLDVLLLDLFASSNTLPDVADLLPARKDPRT